MYGPVGKQLDNREDLADMLLCRCDAVIQHPAQEIFSKAKAFKAISYPGAGHGLNFASNATGAFAAITDFLHESGL